MNRTDVVLQTRTVYVLPTRYEKALALCLASCYTDELFITHAF